MKKGTEHGLAVGLIVLVTVLTYGVLIPRLGFYRDDWYLFSTAQSQGPAGIVALFQIDRPLVGYFYAMGYRLLGISPLAWQVAALCMRIGGNLAFFWVLRLLWPEKRAETVATTLLFTVYPGFTVEPNAGVYITDLAANAAALLSFLFMGKALEASRRGGWLALSALAGVLELLYLGIFESAIGLEVARLGLLWYITWRQTPGTLRQTLGRALKNDVPYLLLAAAFLFWRLFIFQSTRRSTNLDVLIGRYSVLPVRSALSILVETLKDIVETAVFAWFVPFYQFVATGGYRDLTIALGVAAAAVACILLLARRLFRDMEDSQKTLHVYRPVHAIWLGTLIVVFALLPIDLAGRNVLFTDQWDRYTLYASSGVALLVGGFIFHFFQDTARRVFLLILIGMSVVVHYFSAAWYRDFWSWQRDLWQQMVWRAPGITSGTMLFVALPDAGYEEGYEIYGPANMVYYPGQGPQLGGDVLNPATAANIQLQKNRQHYDRSILVEDNYRNSLIAIYPGTQSCLHVLDGREVDLPGLMDDAVVTEVAPYSRIDLIDPTASPSELPTFLRGEEPHPWCLYYQQMDLARQKGDWTEVARLADEAQAKGLTPEDVSEWMPALQAYVTLERNQDARHAASIIRSVDAARAFLCLQLQRGAAYPPPYDYNGVNQTLCQAN